MNEVILPWPPSQLNPNKKLHWAVKAKYAKQYRQVCGELSRKLKAVGDKIRLDITFYPPDKRHRDSDNIIASFKAGQDGLSDALNINDRKFIPTYRFEDKVLGLVVVKILGEDQQNPAA